MEQLKQELKALKERLQAGEKQIEALKSEQKEGKRRVKAYEREIARRQKWVVKTSKSVPEDDEPEVA